MAPNTIPNRASVRQERGPLMVDTPGSIISSGNRTPSRTRVEVTEARMLALRSMGCAENPGASVGTRNPRTPSGVLAQITARSAIPPLVIQDLDPSITQSDPTRRAVVRMEEGSLPASASVKPKQPTTSPLAMRGSHLAFCSEDPYFQMGNMHSDPCTETKLRSPESPASSSKAATPYSTGPRPAQP